MTRVSESPYRGDPFKLLQEHSIVRSRLSRHLPDRMCSDGELLPSTPRILKSSSASIATIWPISGQAPRSSWSGVVVQWARPLHCTWFALDILHPTSPSWMYTLFHRLSQLDTISIKSWVFDCAIGRTCSYHSRRWICGRMIRCSNPFSTRSAW